MKKCINIKYWNLRQKFYLYCSSSSNNSVGNMRLDNEHGLLAHSALKVFSLWLLGALILGPQTSKCLFSDKIRSFWGVTKFFCNLRCLLNHNLSLENGL